jgi:hypothetical protein
MSTWRRTALETLESAPVRQWVSGTIFSWSFEMRSPGMIPIWLQEFWDMRAGVGDLPKEIQ